MQKSSASDQGALISCLSVTQNGTYTVEGAVRTVASPDEVWAVLTDYEGLAEVFSNIKRSTVLSREPEIVLHQVGYLIVNQY